MATYWVAGVPGDDSAVALIRTEALRVEREFLQAQEHFGNRPDDSVGAWQFGRACFAWAEYSTNNTQREAIAELGRTACRVALGIESNSAAAHYYFAVNTGQLARTKRLRALGLLNDMETSFLRAIALDPRFEHAAPHRSLGHLYKDAPGWPTSLGSRRKARQHLETANRLAPEYPENLLLLLEARLEWGERERVRTDLPRLVTVIRSARTNLTGETWGGTWQEWDQRFARLQAAVGAAATRVPLSGKHW